MEPRLILVLQVRQDIQEQQDTLEKQDIQVIRVIPEKQDTLELQV